MTPESSNFFVVGKTYADRKGKYKVTSVELGRVAFEYDDGTQSDGNAEVKSRIYQNILLEQNAQRPTQPRKSVDSGNRVASHFNQDVVFPIIGEIIKNNALESKNYMTHDNIVTALLVHRGAVQILDDCPKNERKTASWWAHNMVAWFSQRITVRESDWCNRLERKEVDGKWAYRVPDIKDKLGA